MSTKARLTYAACASAQGPAARAAAEAHGASWKHHYAKAGWWNPLAKFADHWRAHGRLP